ncbi:MAG: PilW family protein [Halioglobus sp.]
MLALNRNTVSGTFRGVKVTQAGLSLIELLIATALGLIIIAGVAQLYANISISNRELAKANSQIENARFAMQFLRNDIVHAGFWGTWVPEFDNLMLDGAPSDIPYTASTDAPPDPCLPFASWPAATVGTTASYLNGLLGIPIQVYSGSPSANCNAYVSDLQPGSDVLVVRHAERCEAGAANCDADTAGRLYLQVSNCQAEIDAGSPYALDPNTFPLTDKDCTTNASKRRFIQNIYYIRDYAVTDGDGIPTLVRSEFDFASGALSHQPAQALVQGIERMRVEVGIDGLSDSGDPVDYTAAVDWLDPDVWESPTNRGDGVPDPIGGDYFVHCPSLSPACTAAQLANTVVVQLFILARADEESPAHIDTKTYTLGSLNVAATNDAFKRHVFGTTIRVNNVSARRETP